MCKTEIRGKSCGRMHNTNSDGHMQDLSLTTFFVIV